MERLQVCLGQSRRRRHPDAQRVDLLAAEMNLVVQMRPRCHAAHSDIADHLALAYPRALVETAGECVEMPVSRGVLLVMRDFDVVAVAGRAAGKTHHPLPR